MMKAATLVILGALGCSAMAVQAQDLFIFEQSSGTFLVTDETQNDRTISFDTTVNLEFGGLGIVMLDGQFVQTFTGGDSDTYAGSALFTGASNSDTLAVDFSGTLYDDGFASLSGTWTLTGSTGAYAQYTGGAGDNSGSYFFTAEDEGQIFLIFQGTLVPTPSSLALLGLGGMVALRRRR